MSTRRSFNVSIGLLLATLTLAPIWAAADVTLEFDTNRVNQLSISAEAGETIVFNTRGEDPFVLLKPFAPGQVRPEDRVLAFDYFCPDGINDLEIFFGPPIVAGGSFSAGEMRKAESWQPFAVDLVEASGGRWSAKSSLLRLDFGRRAGVELRVRNLRLRPLNDAERKSAAEREAVRQRKADAAATVTRYLNADLPARIESVRGTKSDIVVRGTVADGFPELRLIEAQPWQELWKILDGKAAPQRGLIVIDQSVLNSAATISKNQNGSFEISVPRFDGTRDRITSRWAVAAKQGDGSGRLASHFVYPTDLSVACEHPDLSRITASGIKGMAGVWANDILDELVELGVQHITDNFWISGMFSDTARPGWEEFEHNGRSWWVKPGAIAQHDRLIKFATDHNMTVSAILLVGFGDSGFAELMQHPAAERAAPYAMPNLTMRAGAEAYEAAISFLAERYAQPGNPRGRISNWILHNEIDYGWEWTNMGAQPLAVYLDTYIRSMRIVYNVARQFNPHARVFISLTHNWNVPEDPTWKTYAPRRMLEMLAKYSQVEGDFEWGVAYHPYPQSLFKADAWNDTLPTDNFDTPMITPKNIAVLDRWMHRPEMLYRGHARGVLLSEQGFHTPDYSEAGERLQAAAFVYMWRQLRGLTSIEEFDNHRWVDHPQEGGLKLGLRTLPSPGKPNGDRKFAWEIYKSLDTPEEGAATKFADEIIGETSAHQNRQE
ncbi:hypothetical protein GC207_04270 [bacterium]|nr:hypothetical protein [bacterium]